MKPKYKVLFMGTPEFAVPTLRTLEEAPSFDLPFVITQPDSPSGRKLKLKASPVKTYAQQKGIPVFTPAKVSAPEEVEKIKKENFDAIVVLAYGQILKQDLLDLNPQNFINIHASLLPRWRGAAPIQRAIMEGDELTGISFQIMRFKLDSGPIIFEEKTKIGENENSLELAERLSELSAQKVCEVLKKHLGGELFAQEQNNELVTYARKIEKQESKIDFNKSAQEIHNQVRGLRWGPGAYAFYKGKRLKLFDSEVSGGEGPPGILKRISEDGSRLYIGTAQNLISFKEVQVEGRPKSKVEDFINGFDLTPGSSFLES